MLDLHEALIFTTLGRGAGVPPDSLRGFLSLCHNCDQVFVTTVLDAHQVFCIPPPRVVVPDSASEENEEEKDEEDKKNQRGGRTGRRTRHHSM